MASLRFVPMAILTLNFEALHKLINIIKLMI